jgi:hypothetical protein
VVAVRERDRAWGLLAEETTMVVIDWPHAGSQPTSRPSYSPTSAATPGAIARGWACRSFAAFKHKQLAIVAGRDDAPDRHFFMWAFESFELDGEI